MKPKTLKLIPPGVLILMIIVFISCNSANTEIQVAEAKPNYFKGIYPPGCFYKFQNREYLIKKVFKYKNRILNEYWFPGIEGFAVEKLGLYGNDYNNEQKPYKYLKFSSNKSYVKFNSEKYRIDFQKGDTIISKIDKNKIIIFINEE